MAAIKGSSTELTRIKNELKWVEYQLMEDSTETHYECEFAKGEILVPRGFAWNSQYEKVTFDMCSGYVIDPPAIPILRDHQVDPVSDTLAAFQDYSDVILQAYTGSGKTVMACTVAAELGHTTLIIVDQNKLKKQWVETLVELFGYDESDIGIIQGPESGWQWEGYDFCIAMVQTLYDKDPSDDFLDYFGTMIVDEFDAVGAHRYSNVFKMVPAQNRLSVSATERTDGRANVVRWHLGGAHVKLQAQHALSELRYIEYKNTGPSFYSNKAKVDGRYISELADDGYRNAFICEHLQTMYNSNRTILVIGARVHHLECLYAMMLQKGVPDDDMLVYTGSRNNWRYVKDPKPMFRPPEWEKDTLYTPVHFKLKEKKTKLEDLDKRLHSVRIIFATYAIFSKGVDVPELDAGLEVTPKIKFEQIHGRILRWGDGKLRPIWVTIRDTLSYRAEYQFAARLLEFTKSNVELFKWDLQKGLSPKDVNSLRRDAETRSRLMQKVQVRPSLGGRNVILAPRLGKIGPPVK
jgi:superfamily II DNA or RNA helicase